MRRLYYLTLFIIAAFSSCQKNSLMQKLERIDSLSVKGENNVVLEQLNDIVPESIDDEECLAYYWLLKMRTEIRLYKRIESTEPLDITINYYTRTYNKEKLARAYVYKSLILIKGGKLKESTSCLKQAENLIKDEPKEIALANVIYSNLGFVNIYAQENKIALNYTRKALQAAYKMHSNYHITCELLRMHICYHNLGNEDSAFYYLNKCIPLLESIPVKERVVFYNNIGLWFSLTGHDDDQAEKYFKKSIEINPNAFTFKGLAHIYHKRGEREKALEMWRKALNTNDLYLKTDVLQALYESQQETGNYKDACETAMRIAMLKDSINQKQRDEDIRGLQELSELRRQKDIEKERFIMAMSFAGAFLMLALALTAYLFYLNARKKEDLKKTQEHLEKYRNQLKVLEKEGKKDTKEVERLTQKISELQARQNSQLQNGRERYEDIMADGTTVRWSRNDFADCIEYYRTIDMAFIVHMEQDYKHLSDKYILFAILEHLGKTDEQLQHIMAISQNTVRSYRSRINSASLTPSC